MNESELLFKRFRRVAGKFGKSKKYEKWLKARHPGKSWHHVCGSYMSRKTTDYLSVMVDAVEHSERQDDRAWTIEQLPRAIENLIEYTMENE